MSENEKKKEICEEFYNEENPNPNPNIDQNKIKEKKNIIIKFIFLMRKIIF